MTGPGELTASGTGALPMVLVHGLMETDAVWYRVLPMLAARGRMVALNLAGAGPGAAAAPTRASMIWPSSYISGCKNSAWTGAFLPGTR